MGKVGACGDNAAMESFFPLLQKNVLDRQRWTTREELRLAIFTWIERTYQRRRRQRRLGRLAPVEYETLTYPLLRPNPYPTGQPKSGQSRGSSTHRGVTWTLLAAQAADRGPRRDVRAWLPDDLTADLSVPALVRRVRLSERQCRRHLGDARDG